MAQLASDDFNRANNADLGAAWSQVPGTGGVFQVLSNQAAPSAINVLAAEYYDGGITWPNNQYAEVLCGALHANSRGGGPIIRASTGAYTFYLIEATQAGLTVFRVAAGVHLSLGSYTGTISSTATLRLEAVNSTIRAYINGVRVIEAVNSDIASGKPGIRMYQPNSGTVSQAQFNSWNAGSVNPTAHVDSRRRRR